MIKLTNNVIKDKYTDIAYEMFDLQDGADNTEINTDIELPNEWQIGLIYGMSGAGKSTILKTFFGKPFSYQWDNKAIISNFTMLTPKEASEILCAVGLSTVPSWLRPYHSLSTGERARADLAMAIAQNSEIICVDEFTSVVDRNVAKAMCNAVQKYIRKTDKKIVFASCHQDIIEWLLPDWAFNPTDNKTIYPRGNLCRPKIELQVFQVKYDAWELFKKYHYLTADLNKSARCYVAYWNDTPVAFFAMLPQPSGYFKNGWRASRIVVLPDYQGLGIGKALLDMFAKKVVEEDGGKFFVRMMNPALAMHCLSSPNWVETSHSRKKEDKAGGFKNYKHDTRLCYAFRYEKGT